MQQGGRPDASLPFYEQAATLARAVADAGGEGAGQAWFDLSPISGNWANALAVVGKLDAARQRQFESAEASNRAGRLAVHVIGSELGVLKIDIIQGHVAAASPQIEKRLAQVAAWWKRHRSGHPVPEAPDAEMLARVYISALDAAKDADVAREEWESALGRINAKLEVKRVLERPAEHIAGDRMNRAIVLGALGRFSEAKAELEDCLSVFENDPANRASTFGAIAVLFSKQDDTTQAIAQERRALAIREQLPDPASRAISHNNLAKYLDDHGVPASTAESPCHHLAALSYRLAAGLAQDFQLSLRNYAASFRRAHAAGTELTVPRVSQLLADPAFDPLAQWLTQRQVNLDELQAAVDNCLDQARKAVIPSS